MTTAEGRPQRTPPPVGTEDDVPVGSQGGFPPPPPWEPGTADTAVDTAGTNTMAVLGLVFAFLLPVLGVVFSAVGLAQTRRGGQAGRGLAVAGLVVSLVLVAAAAVVLAVVGPTVRRAVPPSQAGVPGAVSPLVPAGDPADQAVVSACAAVMPAMTRLETDLGGAASLDEVAVRVTALQQQVDAAAASSGDAAFAGHAHALAADFGRLVDAARSGGNPATLVASIEQDGTALGRDCGQAGWLP
jgi:Domain of unknown function (DUF4190)